MIYYRLRSGWPPPSVATVAKFFRSVRSTFDGLFSPRVLCLRNKNVGLNKKKTSSVSNRTLLHLLPRPRASASPRRRRFPPPPQMCNAAPSSPSPLPCQPSAAVALPPTASTFRLAAPPHLLPRVTDRPHRRPRRRDVPPRDSRLHLRHHHDEDVPAPPLPIAAARGKGGATEDPAPCRSGGSCWSRGRTGDAKNLAGGHLSSPENISGEKFCGSFMS